MKQIETVFSSRTEYAYISSSMVKQLIQFGGDISRMVPKETEYVLLESIKKQ